MGAKLVKASLFNEPVYLHEARVDDAIHEAFEMYGARLDGGFDMFGIFQKVSSMAA
jgi:hypothetical protein